ncbi:Endo-1,4-beta-xylanase A precursor [compost metagenome]
MLVRAMGLNLNRGNNTIYHDVQVKDWYFEVITTASAAGLLEGYEDGNFRPNDKMSREQMAVLFDRAIRLSGQFDVLANKQSGTAFKDWTKVSKWAQTGVATSTQFGILQGQSEGELTPEGLVTRAQAATAIKRFLIQAKWLNE